MFKLGMKLKFKTIYPEVVWTVTKTNDDEYEFYDGDMYIYLDKKCPIPEFKEE
jgi:hypothetical protein